MLTRSMILVLLVALQAIVFADSPVSTVSELATVNGSAPGAKIQVAGYYRAGDGGGGEFEWVASSAAQDEGVVFYGLSGSGGTSRWMRVGNDLSVKMFGAIGDGVAEDGAAIQRALTFVYHNAYPTLRFDAGNYRVSGVHPLMSPEPGKTTLYIEDSRINTDNSHDPANSYSEEVTWKPISILHLGFEDVAPRTLRIIGSGATVFTEQELFSPDILLVRPNFESLVIEGLKFKRTTTLNEVPAAGNLPRLADNKVIRRADFDTLTAVNRMGLSFRYSGHLPFVDYNAGKIVVKDVTFDECSPALGVENHPEPKNLIKAGSVKNFVIENCTFLYEKGAKRAAAGYNLPDAARPAAYTAIQVGSLVDLLEVKNCYFDGATSGDVSNSAQPQFSDPLDNFLVSYSHKLSFVGNSLQHFGVEGVVHDTLPLAGEITSTFNQPVPSAYGAQVTVTTNYLHGVPTHIVGGEYLTIKPSGGTWKVVSWNPTTFALTLEWPDDPANPGKPYPGNPELGATAYGNLQGGGLYQTKMFEYWSHIAENHIVGTKPTGTVPTLADSYGFGDPAIRVNNIRANIANNKIKDCIVGIYYETGFKDEGGEGTVIQNNVIDTIDSERYERGSTGIFTYDSRPFDHSPTRVTIRNNTIRMPSAYQSAGITSITSGGIVIGNVIIGAKPPRVGDFTVGIAVWGVGGYLQGNSTRNMSQAITQRPYSSDGQFEIVDHNSDGDLVVAAPTVLIHWKDQQYRWNVPTLGWYRIGNTAQVAQTSGTLTFADGLGWGGSSSATFNQRAWNDRNLRQEKFTLSGVAQPVASNLLIAGHYQTEIFVRMMSTKLPSGDFGSPIKASFVTDMPGYHLKAQPEPGHALTSISHNNPTAGKSTVTFSAALPSLSGWGSPQILLCSNANSAVVPQAYNISSVVSSNIIVVDGLPNLAQDCGFLTNDQLTVDPDTLVGARHLQFNYDAINTPDRATVGQLTSTGNIYAGGRLDAAKLLLALGTGASRGITFGSSSSTSGIYSAVADVISIMISGNEMVKVNSQGLTATGVRSSGTQSATSLGFGFEGDTGQNTGLYLAGENNIGAATDGQNRLNINNNGLSIGGGATGLKGMYSIRTGTSIFGATNVAAFASKDVAVTVTGAQIGDTVLLGLPDTAGVPKYLFTAWVSATNTVTVRAMNVTNAAQTAPAPSKSFRVTVMSFFDGSSN